MSAAAENEQKQDALTETAKLRLSVYMKRLGELIKKKRTLLNVTQAELAERTGCSEEYIRQIEGGRVASMKTAVKVILAVGISLGEVIVCFESYDGYEDDTKTLVSYTAGFNKDQMALALRLIKAIPDTGDSIA